jgi:hypothetical protein
MISFSQITLALLALGVLLGDAWQDYYAWQHHAMSAAQIGSAGVRTVLLLATVAAVLRPSRPLLILVLIALLMALIRRGLFLAPVLSVLDPAGPFLAIFFSGFDLAFRLALLGWAVSWLRQPRDAA